MMKVKIAEIKANSKNPRVIKDDKFKKLVKSIQEFPEMLEKRPLVCYTDIDGKYVVLGGNMRLKASQEIGLKELPIVLADDWTQEQRDEFLIKDNVGFGEWDWDQLANEWDSEKLDDWGLDIPIYEDAIDNELNDLSDKIKSEFRIEIICKDEEMQEKTYNKLIEEGYECRLLTL
jgi:ParB-like chromosome segregation protein Spo0J